MNLLTGIFIVSAETILYALLQPLFKKAGQQIPPFTVMAISMFVLFTLSLLASIFVEGSFSLKIESIRASIPILITIGLINFVSFWLLLLGYKYFPVWQVTMFGLLTPVIAGIFAYFILGEKITVNLFIGLIVMGIGLFIALK